MPYGFVQFGMFEKFSSAYLYQIAREKSCDYLLIIYVQKFSDKQLTVCFCFALRGYHAPHLQESQTFIQLFVLCCVFLFLALSFQLWIKMFLLSANLSGRFVFFVMLLFFQGTCQSFLISTFYTNFVFLHSKFFVLFEINWHALSQSVWWNLCMYIINWLIVYIQKFLHSDWQRACQLIPNSAKIFECRKGLITWRISSRAGISARLIGLKFQLGLLKQILWKLNCRLHGEGFSPGWKS